MESMASLEQPAQDKSKSLTDDAASTAPHIVNGLTVRPREKVSPWLLGLLVLPDFASLLVLVGLGMHRLLRYLGVKGSTNS